MFLDRAMARGVRPGGAVYLIGRHGGPPGTVRAQRRVVPGLVESTDRWGIPAQIDQPRGRFNIIMSAISIKFAVIGYSWALITNIKLVFEYILPFRNYSLRRF